MLLLVVFGKGRSANRGPYLVRGVECEFLRNKLSTQGRFVCLDDDAKCQNPRLLDKVVHDELPLRPEATRALSATTGRAHSARGTDHVGRSAVQLEEAVIIAHGHDRTKLERVLHGLIFPCARREGSQDLEHV